MTLADNSTRRLDFPKDYLDQNQKDAEEVVIFQATVDKIMNLQEGNTFEPEQVTSVALATNGVRVSNELGLKIVRQPKE